MVVKRGSVRGHASTTIADAAYGRSIVVAVDHTGRSAGSDFHESLVGCATRGCPRSRDSTSKIAAGPSRSAGIDWSSPLSRSKRMYPAPSSIVPLREKLVLAMRRDGNADAS
jgi:hypothetical protein